MIKNDKFYKSFKSEYKNKPMHKNILFQQKVLIIENTDNKEHQKSAYGNDRSKPGNSCGIGGNSIRTT